MQINQKLLRTTALLICGLLFFTSCNIKGTTPTTDPNSIYTQAVLTVSANETQSAQAAVTEVDIQSVQTQAVETVIAQLTQDAPKVTPTNTEEPMRPTLTPADQTGEATQDTGVVVEVTPTKSSTKTKVEYGEFLYQWPTDGHEMAPSQEFDTVWRFRNIGDTTWNSSYTIRWYMANKFGLSQLKYTFADYANKQTVAKGEVVEITVPGMVAPSAAGHYFSHWRLCNDKVQCFYLVYVEIVVN